MLSDMCSTNHNEKSQQSFATVFSRRLHVLEIIFCISSPEICLFRVLSLQRRVFFPAWLQYHRSSPSQPLPQSWNSDGRNQHTTVSCSEQANVSTGILHQNPSAYRGEAISYGWGNFVRNALWCKCMQSFAYKATVMFEDNANNRNNPENCNNHNYQHNANNVQ